MTTQFARIVSEDQPDNQAATNVSFVDEDGKAIDIGGGTVPDLSAYAKTADLPKAATVATAGTAKQAAAVAAPAADADAAALSTTLAAVIKAMQDSGQMATA
jgi:predicted ThiF/HesA family dinucleotide-utilizing enzyme